MNYKLKRSQRKTLALSILDGELIVRAPLQLPLEVIDAFVKEKKPWIEKKLSQYKPVGIDITQDTVRLFGVYVPLNLYKDKRFRVDVKATSLDVYTPSLDNLSKKIEDGLKQSLIHIIDEALKDVSLKLNIKIPPYKIRRYKRIHGRCSSKGDLAFNLYLFHESIDFIYYVVLHECAHLFEFNHSKAFYDIIKTHMPDYKAVIAASKSL